MAKQFIYDSVGLTEATVTDGINVAIYTTFATSNVLTNEFRANDSSITGVVESFALNDTIRFDLGSSKTAGVIALYFADNDSDDMKLYAHDTSTDMGTEVVNMPSFSTGWNVFTFSDTSARYWFLRCSVGFIGQLTEVIIGTKYEFTHNPDLNSKISDEFGTDIMTSYGGQEYANKRHEPKQNWDWTWSYMLSSMKDDLQTMSDAVQDYKKFIYYDETSYNYVRMTKPMEFTEVAPDIFSTSMSLREQLS